MMSSPDYDPRKEGKIWVMEMKGIPPVISALVPVTFGRVGAEAIPALLEAMGPSSAPEIAKRLGMGSRCYAGWVEDRLACYGWVSFREEYIGELNLWIRLQPDEAYIWDCVTLPDFRNLYLYSALLSHILRELRPEPLSRVWIGHNLDNLPSEKGIARAGFRAVAEMAIARVLAMRQVWVIGLPGAPESLVTEARRVFLDNRDQLWLHAVEESRKY